MVFYILRSLFIKKESCFTGFSYPVICNSQYQNLSSVLNRYILFSALLILRLARTNIFRSRLVNYQYVFCNQFRAAATKFRRLLLRYFRVIKDSQLNSPSGVFRKFWDIFFVFTRHCFSAPINR